MYTLEKNSDTSVILFEMVKEYKAFTKFAFSMNESVLVAQLLSKGISLDSIEEQVIEDDILSIRSKVSRKGAIRVIKELLTPIPTTYIDLLASGNSDLRRFTFLLLTLRVNRFLREVISELLVENLLRLKTTLDHKQLQSFFSQKREQEIVLSQWSHSTYQKVCSNTILTLVRAGLLRLNKNRAVYEIQPMPIPHQLKERLMLDRLDGYIKLMLN